MKPETTKDLRLQAPGLFSQLAQRRLPLTCSVALKLNRCSLMLSFRVKAVRRRYNQGVRISIRKQELLSLYKKEWCQSVSPCSSHNQSECGSKTVSCPISSGFHLRKPRDKLLRRCTNRSSFLIAS